jgi:hypothetical protein
MGPWHGCLPLALLDFHRSACCYLHANRTYDSRLSLPYTFTHTCSNQAYDLLLLFLPPYRATPRRILLRPIPYSGRPQTKGFNMGPKKEKGEKTTADQGRQFEP